MSCYCVVESRVKILGKHCKPDLTNNIVANTGIINRFVNLGSLTTKQNYKMNH